MTEKIDYNKSYSFRQNESTAQKKNTQDDQQANSYVISDFRQSTTNQDLSQENPLSQYKILLQLSSQLLLENTVNGKRVIYKEFAIPQNKGFQEMQSELMRRKAIDCNNILKLNLFLIEKQQTKKPLSDQKFGVVFDNFIRDFDSELETRKGNKKNILSSMKENGVVLHSKDQIHQGLLIMSKVNSIQLFWTEEEILNTLESVLLGICELHKNNIIHGDFNASSVVFCDDGFVKIADQFVTNPDVYQKEKVQQFQQSYLPPEKTFYTAEGDFWAIGMVFLEAAILESSQDLYSFKFENLQSCQENQSEDIYQINFKLLQSRIQDLVLLSQSQNKQNQLQTVLNLLLSKEPSKRGEALLHFEALKHYYSSNQFEYNQICQVRNINSLSNISEPQIQMSKISINQSIAQKNQEIQDNHSQNQTLEQKIPCMKISLSPHKSLIQAHKQQRNIKNNQQLNLQILEGQNKDNYSSSLSFCTQSNSSQTSKERNQEKDMQILVNSNILKQNLSIKNKGKGIQRNQNVKNLDEICNIGISIPSLEVSPIVNDICKPYKEQLQQVKTLIKQEKENIEKNIGISIQRQKRVKEQYQQKSQLQQNINAIDNKNKRTHFSKQDNKENQGNMSMQSRSSTMIDFYLSNPSNKNGMESPQNLSFESQSCKSQSNQSKLVYNYFKSQKNKNNDSELNFVKQDKIKKLSQQKISQSLNNSIDYVNQFKESTIQLQRDKSLNSNRQHEKENRIFIQEKSKSQQNNRQVDQNQNYTSNNQNNQRSNVQNSQVNVNQQKRQQQLQSEQNIQQQQQQLQGIKKEEIQINKNENQMNDRVRSQLSIKKQYSTLSNLIDSCLQRSRSLTSSSINRSQSMQERNILNSSFQNTSNYQSQLNNSLNSISVKLQTTTKKHSLQDQQKNELSEFDKDQAGYEIYKKYSDNYEIQDQERQFQSNTSAEIQKNNFNQNFHSNQPQKGLQESPVLSNRRNLPPKSTSRSSKKGMKQDLNNSQNQQSLQEQAKQYNNSINFKQIDQMSIKIQSHQDGFKDKQGDISQINSQTIKSNNKTVQNQQPNTNNIEYNMNQVKRQINNLEQEIKSNSSQNIYSESSLQSVDDMKTNSQQLFNEVQQKENISLYKNEDQQSIINQQQIQIDIMQVELSEQLSGDSFQVFKASEQSTHREKQASCKKLNINELRSQLEQNSILQNNLKKPTPQNIQIRIQNFIYDDDWVSYDGQYFNNTFSGVGFLKLKNNCSYHGEFLMGKLNGYGSFYIGQQNTVVLGYFQNNILIKKCN
ncbi:hypothetical protein TTHERM_00388630 (macronuclear) [Tetrahymena thermophila SB210]|uniref:Protein kinase domain-containing protein n=1 Tax=Tetrahymena thermophila (strain SB210) TaxID=312017 RepID=Q23RC6_TETTS|nr:hypothetical protein TTHERM_00388630 [Tetrahymena thermophila SB210]EAR99122.1 hypothetical protein TTHERM_00388630 [Tetrahymena thermophila SB210]|eukprot:XP_001019367.1 hypothetical protein TTHERM_00388630 [Tetrahymena thermophila SB210]